MDDVASTDRIAGDLLPPGGLLGSYVLVAEVVTEYGTSLQVATNSGMTPWGALGMLLAAQHIVQHAADVLPHEEPYEEGEM